MLLVLGVGQLTSLSAVAFESYDDLDAFDTDLLLEEADPRTETLRLRVAYMLAPLDNTSFTDWDFNVVTDAMIYGRFAADDVMHMDMGAGVAFRYATLEKDGVPTGIANAEANIDNFYWSYTARFAMGLGFALSESWRLDFMPYVGVGAAFAKYRVRQGGILAVNEVKDSGWAPAVEYGFSTGVWYKPGYKWDVGVDLLFDGAFSEHIFDPQVGNSFDANYRQFNLAIAVGAGYWF
jgi:hypothetical protein